MTTLHMRARLRSLHQWHERRRDDIAEYAAFALLLFDVWIWLYVFNLVCEFFGM